MNKNIYTLAMATFFTLCSQNSFAVDKSVTEAESCAIPTAPIKYVPFSTVQFNSRTQYRTGSEKFLQMFRLSGVIKQPGNILKGTYWSIETDSNMGKNMDEFSASYQEIEMNHAFWHKSFYVSPGYVWHWESAGSQVDPYLEVGYRWDPTFTTAIRYRYNYWTYFSKDVNKDWDRQAEHRIDLYITKNFTDKFKIQYNPTFYQKVADTQYYYKNDKRHTLQHNFIISYQMSDRFIPYTELGYLDKTKNDKGDKVSEYQIRLGFRYNLN